MKHLIENLIYIINKTERQTYIEDNLTRLTFILFLYTNINTENLATTLARAASVFRTPYVFLKATKRQWLAFMDRTLPKMNEPAQKKALHYQLLHSQPVSTFSLIFHLLLCVDLNIFLNYCVRSDFHRKALSPFAA